MGEYKSRRTKVCVLHFTSTHDGAITENSISNFDICKSKQCCERFRMLKKVWPAYWQFEYFLNGVNGWKTSLQCTADHFCRRVEFYIWFSLSLSLAADASLRRRPSLSLSFNQPNSPFPVLLKSFPWPLPHSLASGCKVSGAQRGVLNALLKNVVPFSIL